MVGWTGGCPNRHANRSLPSKHACQLGRAGARNGDVTLDPSRFFAELGWQIWSRGDGSHRIRCAVEATGPSCYLSTGAPIRSVVFNLGDTTPRAGATWLV